MKAKSRQRNRKPAMTDKEAEQLYKNYRARKAVMTRQRMYEYEDAIQHSNRTDNWGQARRVVLAVVSMPAKELMRGIEEDRETALAIACAQEMVANYSRVLRQLSELVAEADRRMMIALCGRADMNAIPIEAREANLATQALPSCGAARGAMLQTAKETITRPRPRLVVNNDPTPVRPG